LSELFIEVGENGQSIDPYLCYLPEEENNDSGCYYEDEAAPAQPFKVAEPSTRPTVLADESSPPPEPDDWHLQEPPGVHSIKPIAASEKPAPAAQPGQPNPAPTSEPADKSTAIHRPVDSSPAVNVPPVSINTLRYLIAPLQPGASPEDSGEIRMLKVILRASDDKSRDVRRLRRVHGVMRSMPGTDKFAVLLFEGGNRVLIEFPNETTGICTELLQRLTEMVGEGNVLVETIKLQ
jgi:hypothetical protein